MRTVAIKYWNSSPTISRKPDGIGAACQLWIARGELSIADAHRDYGKRFVMRLGPLGAPGRPNCDGNSDDGGGMTVLRLFYRLGCFGGSLGVLCFSSQGVPLEPTSIFREPSFSVPVGIKVEESISLVSLSGASNPVPVLWASPRGRSKALVSSPGFPAVLAKTGWAH